MPAMTPSQALEQYTGDLLSSTREWTNLHDDELKRRAVRAAGDKDSAELVSLTTAYLAHGGSSGVNAVRQCGNAEKSVGKLHRNAPSLKVNNLRKFLLREERKKKEEFED